MTYNNLDRRIKKNIETFKQSERERFLNEQTEIVDKRNKLVEETAMNYHKTISSRYDRRRALNENLDRKKSIIESLLVEALDSIFFESLVLDDDYKTEQCENVLNYADTTFKKLFEENILDIKLFKNSQSETVRNIYECCEMAADNINDLIANKQNTKEKVEETLTKAGVLIDYQAENIKNIIKDKVVDVVKNERELAEKNQLKREEIKYEDNKEPVFKKVEEPTFFRSLLIGASKQPINESFELCEEINTNMAFAKALMHYTLLETLNTTKLFDLTPKDWTSLARSFRK